MFVATEELAGELRARTGVDAALLALPIGAPGWGAAVEALLA